jgi:hypothetical protein
MLGNDDEVPSDADQLLRLVQRDGIFWVDKAATASNSKKLWLVVRDVAAAGHKLVEGDVIKLGRFKFRVRQMVGTECNGKQADIRLEDTGKHCCIDMAQIPELSRTMCRICLTEGCSEDDPLISPCSCKGSIAHVHLGCLRHWIRGRLNLSDDSTSFFYRPLSCELCKKPYPSYISACSVDGSTSKYPLVEAPHIKAPFIALENMVRDHQQHSTRGLHVISLADNKLLKLGRGHESDVRIADVSISRCHATIRFHRGQFVLKDHDSKFGTLVAMRKPRPLEATNALSIQVGRTVLSVSLQPHAPQEDMEAQSIDLTSGLQQRASCNPQDERALRLSLLTRNSSHLEEEGWDQVRRVSSRSASDWQHHATLSAVTADFVPDFTNL